MSGDLPNRRTVRDLPDADCAAASAGDDLLTIRRERNGPNVARTDQSLPQFARRRFVNAKLLIEAHRRQQRAVVIERDRVNRVIELLNVGQRLIRREVPAANPSVVAGRVQRFCVRTDRQRANPVRVALEFCDQLAVGHREQPHRVIVASRDERLAIRREANGRDHRWVADDRVLGHANHPRGRDLSGRLAQPGRPQRPDGHADQRKPTPKWTDHRLASLLAMN